MNEIDKKDRKLLYYLNKNARLSDSQLSKMVEVSKNTVKYRKQRLIKLGVIRNFSTIINLGAIGYSTMVVLFRFKEELYSDKEILPFFKDNKNIIWSMTLSGGYDLLVEFAVKGIDNFQVVIQECLYALTDKIIEYKTFFSGEILRTTPLIKEVYVDLDLQDILGFKRNITSKPSLSNTQKLLLNLMSKDSTMSIVDLSESVKKSIPIVRGELKRLQDEGIVLRYTALIDTAKLGYSKYLCKIELNSTNQEELGELKKRITNNGSITYAFMDMFSFSIIFLCSVRSTEALDRLLRDIKKEFGGLIKDQEQYIVKEQLKQTYFPDSAIE